MTLSDGVRSDGDADGREHGLQGKEHDVGFCSFELVIEESDGDLADGGGDFFGRERRDQVEGGGGLLLLVEDALSIGGNSKTPQQDLGERGLGDGFGDFFVVEVVFVVRCESRI